MNEKLQEELVKVIQKSVEGVESGIEFMSAEIPDVLRQLIIWHGWVGMVKWCIFLLTLIFILLSVKRIIKNFDNDDYDYIEKIVWTVVVSLIPVTILSIMVFQLSWLKALLTPNLFILEYAIKLGA